MVSANAAMAAGRDLRGVETDCDSLNRLDATKFLSNIMSYINTSLVNSSTFSACELLHPTRLSIVSITGTGSERPANAFYKRKEGSSRTL